MDFKKHLESAWNVMLQNLAALIFLTIATLAVSAITLGILAPVAMAGYVHAILLLLREGREPKVQDVFSQMRLFLPLLLFGIVIFLGAMIGFALLFLPGVVFILAVSFCCLYMMPLMTDRNLGLIDAVKESYSMVTSGKLGDHIIVFVLFAGITAVGGSVLLGTIFTQPLATLFLMSVYQSLEKTEAAVPEAPSPPAPPSAPAQES